ncbi:hypothetical protein RIF29_21769 [Crotalaria pallida]|uniref:Uncharacterized protein n=1 Tax=Crotalaria pallida TaxID=3830 RepID=A0AAN9F3P0_CROPI
MPTLWLCWSIQQKFLFEFELGKSLGEIIGNLCILDQTITITVHAVIPHITLKTCLARNTTHKSKAESTKGTNYSLTHGSLKWRIR